jgi:hypothetical protein
MAPLKPTEPKPTKDIRMEQLLVLAIILVGFAVLGAFALTVGVDSRDSIVDDWNRRPVS